MISKFLLLICLLIQNTFALDFTPGTGSEFQMTTGGQKVDLSIYITKAKGQDLGVEFHFGAGGFLVTNMWQQFNFEIGSGPVRIKSGFIKTTATAKSEIMTPEFFTQNADGVEMQDFLFSKKAEIQKFFIADEKIEIPAGSIIAKHYRKKRGTQIIDFWISEKVGPISLVKLESKGAKNSHHNYSIELSSLLKNVKPSIDPSKAIPLTKDTAEMLKKTKNK